MLIIAELIPKTFASANICASYLRESAGVKENLFSH
ncbi:hypothetical protein FHS59_002514 [Algoriphagus iocasae]|uniref:Uncharacterized protein n=1 Tax=Algoriphagus iocasae TaxID=1836499 RepID=A0A841MRW1_9BACT|nr:hypothetical protein [Algoriphagus iocasae]